uniref:CRIB domain-containing protein n=1 Tax=Trichobilharzia regenti TaxID=157069 RepID=A0AA85K1V3_TRIRE|nr:unnamed protein product [Trichobilharzia regenti]
MFCCIPNNIETRRVKIDRYSIGNPIDFRHVAHMGTSALYEDNVSNALGLLDHQSLPVHLKLIDLPKLSNNNTSLSSVPFVATKQSPTSNETKPSKRNSFLNATSMSSTSHETGRNIMRHSTHLSNLSPSRPPCLDLSLPLPPPPPPPPPLKIHNSSNSTESTRLTTK